MGGAGYAIDKRLQPRFAKLVAKVLADVKPTKTELASTTRDINEVMGRLKKVTPKNVEILVAGSVARGTQIRGASDIDIFLLFPRSMEEKALEKKGLEIAKMIVDKKKGDSYSMKYAEHPYTTIKFGKLPLEVEIVPAYKIKDIKERSTAVDRTQLHNEFVNSNLTMKQRDDVRVLKTFLNSHHIYGAEARVEGFSGYLCELLVYHYKSFEKLVVAFANLRLPTAIDLSKLHSEFDKGSSNVKKFVERFGKDFIVIDPVDENRNVAASVSDESLAKLVLASQRLVSEVNEKAFFGSGYSDTDSKARISKLREKLNTHVYLLHFKTDDVAEDIIWQQTKRLKTRITEVLERNGFAPLLSFQNIKGNEAIIAFFINEIMIKARIVKGPSVLMHDAACKFMKSHKGAFFVTLSGSSLASIEKPRYSDAHELLRAAVSGSEIEFPSYIKKRQTKLYADVIPEELAKMLYESYCISTDL